jgi:hypothetical protein
MKQDIRTFVVECDTCQCNKEKTVKDTGVDTKRGGELVSSTI